MNNKGDKTEQNNDGFSDSLELFDNLFLEELNNEENTYVSKLEAVSKKRGTSKKNSPNDTLKVRPARVHRKKHRSVRNERSRKGGARAKGLDIEKRRVKSEAPGAFIDGLRTTRAPKEKVPARKGLDHRERKSQSVEVRTDSNCLSASSTTEEEIFSEKRFGRKRKILKDIISWGNGAYHEENGGPAGWIQILSKLRSTVGRSAIKVALTGLALAILIVLSHSSRILDSADSEGWAEQPLSLDSSRKAPPYKSDISNKNDIPNLTSQPKVTVKKVPLDNLAGQNKLSNRTIRGQPEGTLSAPGVLPKGEPLTYPYSIYLGSYGILESAKKAVSQYEKRGLPIYWVKVHLGKKGVWFRIFTGCFSTKKQAEEYIKKMNVSDAIIKKTGYSALIGVYSSKKELERDADELLKLGFCPYATERRNGTSQLYSGAFITKSGAERHHMELTSMGIESRVVER